MDSDLTIWQYAKQFLAFDCMTEDEIYKGLISGRSHLWAVYNAACVCEVTDANMYHILTGGGSLRGMLPVLPDIEKFAFHLGCKGIELSGRRGWFRIFPKLGYIPNGNTLVKYF